MFNMNTNSKGTAEFAGSYACSTTVLAYEFGIHANAFVRCPLKQIDGQKNGQQPFFFRAFTQTQLVD